MILLYTACFNTPSPDHGADSFIKAPHPLCMCVSSRSS
jgi:hypothetical protein